MKSIEYETEKKNSMDKHIGTINVIEQTGQFQTRTFFTWLQNIKQYPIVAENQLAVVTMTMIIAFIFFALNVK